MNGRIVRQQSNIVVSSQAIEVNIRGLSPGVYAVEIEDPHMIKAEKLIIH